MILYMVDTKSNAHPTTSTTCMFHIIGTRLNHGKSTIPTEAHTSVMLNLFIFFKQIILSFLFMCLSVFPACVESESL